MIGDDGQPETEIVEMVIPRFRVTTVFDVSQTEGEPIAELEVSELTGSVQFYDTFMEALQNISPVPIRMMEIEGEAKGYYHQTEKYIAIQEDMSNLQTMKTGVHEVSHALLHDREVMDAEGILKDRTTKEVEAESIAYIVCNHFGLDTSEYSFTYIASWCESKDMKALRASMDTIRKTSAEVIENIETQMHELEMERPVRDTFHKEDLILHLSGSMGSEFTYDLIENMSREQLEQNVGEYVRLLESGEIEENEKPLESFLEEKVLPSHHSMTAVDTERIIRLIFMMWNMMLTQALLIFLTFLRKSRQRCWCIKQSFQEIFFRRRKGICK